MHAMFISMAKERSGHSTNYNNYEETPCARHDYRDPPLQENTGGREKWHTPQRINTEIKSLSLTEERKIIRTSGSMPVLRVEYYFHVSLCIYVA